MDAASYVRTYEYKNSKILFLNKRENYELKFITNISIRYFLIKINSNLMIINVKTFDISLN